MVPGPTDAGERGLQCSHRRAAAGVARPGGARAQPERDHPAPRDVAHHLRAGGWAAGPGDRPGADAAAAAARPPGAAAGGARDRDQAAGRCGGGRQRMGAQVGTL